MHPLTSENLSKLGHLLLDAIRPADSVQTADGRSDTTMGTAISSTRALRHLVFDTQRSPARVSWEALPSRHVDVLPGIHNADVDQQRQYFEAIKNALDGFPDDMHSAQDLIAQRVGLPVHSTAMSSSAYEGVVGHGGQSVTHPFTPPTSPLASPVGSPRFGRAPPPPRTSWETKQRKLDLYSAILGLVLQQDAVVWQVPKHCPDVTRHNAIEIEAKGIEFLSPQQVETLYNAINEKAGHTLWAPAHDGYNKLHIVNADVEQRTNDDFHRTVMGALNEQMSQGFPHARAQTFRADSRFVSTNWECEDAQGYVDLIDKAGKELFDDSTRAELHRWIEDLAGTIQHINDEFSMRFGWGNAGDLKKVVAPLQHVEPADRANRTSGPWRNNFVRL